MASSSSAVNVMDVEPSTYLTDAEKGKLKDAASNVFRAECQRELAFWEAVVAFDKDGKVPCQYVGYLPMARSRALYTSMVANVSKLYNHAATDLLTAKMAAGLSHLEEDKTVMIQFTEGAFYITPTKRPEDAEPCEPPAVKRQRNVEII
jgi:hypothetical protein